MALMKNLHLIRPAIAAIFLTAGMAGVSWAQATTVPAAAAPAACPALLKHEFARLQDDTPQNLCQYAGKVVLVVNTASYCGFTRQYEGLEALYAKYQSRGLVVLGFPSNDFGKQEPGSAKEIADFCFNTYGVKFPMFAKTVVSGSQRNPLYAELMQATKAEPKWNFHKFLIDRSGKPVASFVSNVEPENVVITSAIEKALNQKL
ncbi:MAG: glutathione peroxidase [Burkholderiales bacterium PBB3]|nr:MAG: glutathione peroxidase [Burkholderiales bacterium PBB3]